jgi:hypothetical protein
MQAGRGETSEAGRQAGRGETSEAGMHGGLTWRESYRAVQERQLLSVLDAMPCHFARPGSGTAAQG